MAISKAELLHRQLPLLLTIVCLVLVAAVLLGWGLGVEVLVRGASGRAAMVPGTAIALALLFLGLLLHLMQEHAQDKVIFCAAAAAMVVLTNSVVVALDPAGLDALLKSRAPRDRMSPGTMTGLLSGALGLAGLGSARLLRREVPMLAALSGLSGIIAVLAVHNFRLGAPLSLPFVSAMSIYTALCLLAFNAALLLVSLAPSASSRVPESHADG
ncbi:hypothetical protein [Salipiger mangrovisoli]|uniref:Uncharacterized protein n=1 Tax=Salipiger mangrovisoli TaxID=2865933 RepID=A0ABR9WVR0_9RHOB|nr:hypothetical protein [Salipiger mangrovisoli]MBE9635366.1 hypothetical protein [Salipiger mangrovisoli]